MADTGHIEEVQDDTVYKNPLGVTSDEDGPTDFVRACIVIPGVKKRTLKNEIKNGRVEFTREARSFSVKVFLRKDNKSKEEAFRYSVKQLPDEIDPEACYYKVKDGQVICYLKKIKSRSWSRELDEGGLETFVDEEEENGMDD